MSDANIIYVPKNTMIRTGGKTLQKEYLNGGGSNWCGALQDLLI